jgi:hypothetical protein
MGDFAVIEYYAWDKMDATGIVLLTRGNSGEKSDYFRLINVSDNM